jgi:signal transduction histidine kinase
MSGQLENEASLGAPESALAGDIVHLESLRRLALGAAHTLNNALTSILGEVRALGDERAHDAEVARACAEIESQVERCARLTHALQARGWRRETPAGELDLTLLARSLAPLLRDTVSRSIDLEWELPGEGIWVCGRREDVELLVLLAAHRVLRSEAAGRSLRVRLEHSPAGAVDLLLEREATSAAPPGAPSPWEHAVEAAARALALRDGIGWLAEERAGRLRLRFVAAADPG